MKKYLFSSMLSAAMLLSVGLSSCQKEQAQPTPSTVYTPNFMLAKTSNELIALRKNPEANIIRTLGDFDAAMANSPLAKMPKELRNQFRSQIVVREGVGVVGLNYALIQQNLSEEEFAQVMGMFGMDTKHGYWGFSKDAKIQHKLSGVSTSNMLDEEVMATDYSGYECLQAHTCKVNSTHICLSGC